MKNLWSAQKILEVTKGELKGPSQWSAPSFCIDSRTLMPGEVFIALKGAQVNGHTFISQVAQKGAVAAIVDTLSDHYPPDFPLIVVPHTDKALMDLGHGARTSFTGKVIGVTGSAGKTSTKDMLAFCLSDQGKTHKSARSFNTKLGVPLTMANCPPGTQFLVLEIGMSLPGEIASLTHLAKPHVAIITTIGHAHLEYLKSLDGVATAKAEIFQGILPGGATILNGDLPQTDLLVQKAKENHVTDILLFGETPGCQTQLLSYKPIPTGSFIEASILGEKASYHLQTFGKHHAMNSLAVLTAIKFLKGDLKQATKSLGLFKETEGRGKSYALKEGILLVDETYNANPDSMKAALLAFSERPKKGRRIIVLGDMLDLGHHSPTYHKNLKNILLSVEVDHVLTYGPAMNHLFQGIKNLIPAHHFEDLPALSEFLLKMVQPHDEVFMKSSNGMKLSAVAKKMMEYYAV